MQELNMVEVDDVGGGIIGVIMLVYAIADVIYDFNKGIQDAKSGKA